MITFQGYLKAGNEYINTNKISDIKINDHTTAITLDNKDTFELSNGYRKNDGFAYADANDIFTLINKADKTGFADYSEIAGDRNPLVKR